MLKLNLQTFAAIDANEVINGTYGFVYDENGQEVQATQEFEANIGFSKEEITLPGQFMTSHKVMGGSGSGSMNFLKLDSRLQAKIAANPTAKYVYRGRLADPTARGEEAVILRGVSFDGVQLMRFAMGELADVDLEFTFDGHNFAQTI